MFFTRKQNMSFCIVIAILFKTIGQILLVLFHKIIKPVKFICFYTPGYYVKIVYIADLAIVDAILMFNLKTVNFHYLCSKMFFAFTYFFRAIVR